VLKHILLHYNRFNFHQPPSGGCVLKHAQ